MIFNTISMRYPNKDSGSFYSKFFNLYSFIQVNNLVFHFLIEKSKESDIEDFIKEYNGLVMKDYENVVTHLFGMGIDGRGFIKSNETRGICSNLIDEFEKGNKEKVEFFLNLQEFLLLYSIFEETIKQICNSTKDSKVLLREGEILNGYFEILDNNNIQLENFKDKISNKSCNILVSKDEINLLWSYFTHLRHLYVHAAGFVSKKFKQNISGIKKNIEKFCMKKDFMILNCIHSDNDEDI